MQTPAAPPAADPLALPADQIWLEELIDASIARTIARDEWEKSASGGGRRFAVAVLFRRATHRAELEAWAQFCAARERLPVSHYYPQQVAG